MPTGVKGNSLVSPIGMEQAPPDEVIDTPNETKTEEPPLQPRVHISKTTEAVEADALPMYEAPPRRSILQNATCGVNQGQVCETSEPQDNNNPRNDASHVMEVHDRKNMLFKEYSDNGMKETCYHVSALQVYIPCGQS